MAQGADVLASSLQDLQDGYTEQYLRSLPLANRMLGPETGEKLQSKLKTFKTKGPYVEFDIVTNGPGTLADFPTGDEPLIGIRRPVAVKGNQFTGMSVYYYNVPGKDLMEAGGENDYAKIIDNYPKMALGDTMAMFNRQLCRGAGSAGTDPVAQGAKGNLTLNGIQSYTPNGASRTGVFQFVAPASQSATVFGIAMSTTTGWYHQHDHINSFASEGMKKYRAIKRLCNAQGVKMGKKGVDLICADPGTWNNMLEHMDGAITMINQAGYPIGAYENRDGFSENGVDWYADDDIDITDTTAFDSSTGGTNARLGVAYVLTSSFWEFAFQGNHPDMMGTGFLDMRQYVPLQDQLHFQFRIISNWNIFCKSLRNQADLTGGAQE